VKSDIHDKANSAMRHASNLQHALLGLKKECMYLFVTRKIPSLHDWINAAEEADEAYSKWLREEVGPNISK